MNKVYIIPLLFLSGCATQNTVGTYSGPIAIESGQSKCKNDAELLNAELGHEYWFFPAEASASCAFKDDKHPAKIEKVKVEAIDSTCIADPLEQYSYPQVLITIATSKEKYTMKYLGIGKSAGSIGSIRLDSFKKMINQNHECLFNFDPISKLKISKGELSLIQSGKYRIGMTDKAAWLTFGSPSEINSTRTAGKTFDQWVYSLYGRYVYIENGIMSSIQEHH